MSRSQATTPYRRLGIAFVSFGLSLTTVSFLIQAAVFAGLGLASFLIGLLLIYIPVERVVSPKLVSALCISSLVNLNSLLEELGVDSKAIYLPTKEGTHQPRAFLPLIRNPDASLILAKRFEADGLLTVDTSDPHRSGIVLVPPGSSLLSFIEEESGIDLYNVSLDELGNVLRTGLAEAVEIAEDVRVISTDGSVRVEVGPLMLEELCQMQSKVAPSLCSQVGCPLCSAVICAITKAAKRPVSVVKISSLAGRRVSIELKLLEGD